MLVAFKDFVKAVQRRARCLFLPAAWAARSLPQNLFGGANRYTPSPLSRRRASCLVCLGGGCLAARLLGLRPPPPALVLRRSCGAAAAAAAFASGLRAAAVPSIAAPRGGGGFQAWVRSRLPVAAVLGAGYAPPATICRGLPLRPAAVWARKRAPLHGRLADCALLPRCRWAQAALRLCFRTLPARCRWQPLRGMQPRCKSISKLHRKAPKSGKTRAFCAAYRRKRHGLRQQTVR